MSQHRPWLKAPSGSATKLDGDTIGTGKVRALYIDNNLPEKFLHLILDFLGLRVRVKTVNGELTPTLKRKG